MSKTNDYGLVGVGCVGITVVLAFAILFSMILNGIVVMNLWNWLLVPVFEQLPTFDIVTGIGVSFAISFLAKANVPIIKAKDSNEAISNLINTVLVTPLIVLLFGYIISLLY